MKVSLAKHLLLEPWLAKSLPLHSFPARNLLFQPVLAERAEGLLLHPSRAKKSYGARKDWTPDERGGKGFYMYLSKGYESLSYAGFGTRPEHAQNIFPDNRLKTAKKRGLRSS